MSNFNQVINGEIYGSSPTFQAAAAITQGQLVKYATGGQVDVCGVDEQAIGVALKDVDAGDYVAVRLLKDSGIHVLIASAAIADGATVHTAAAGKVADAGLVAIGTALEAAAADGDTIKVLAQ